MRTLFFIFLIISCSSPQYRKIEKVPGKITFCVVGDVGNGSSTQRKVAASMEKSGCEKLIILGDVIYPHGLKSADDKKLTDRFIEPYRNFRQIYIVLGNHDYEGDANAWKEIARRDSRIIHPGNFFREKHGGTCLFFLDTNFSSPSKGMFEKETSWLKNSIEDCGYMIAFTHHPYISSGRRHGHATKELKIFYENFVIGKFQLIFSGHEHILKDEGMKGGTRQIISGAGGKHDFGQRPGYAIFILDPENPVKSVIEIRPL